jgi:acyl transferase domain-containing protein
MAVTIVNLINRRFALDLPLNACHTFVDEVQLISEVTSRLGVHVRRPHAIHTHPALPSTHQEEVVIVGMACRLPGDINTPNALWEALIARRADLMVPIPTERWDHASFYSPIFQKPGDITLERAGFISLDSFDNNFFGIPPSEALMTSPSIRLALETSFEALENANITSSSLKGTDTGVFIATGTDEGYGRLVCNSKGYDGKASHPQHIYLC